MKILLGKMIDGKIKPLADIQLNKTGRKIFLGEKLKHRYNSIAYCSML